MSQPVVVQTLPVIAYSGSNAASKTITIPAGGVAGGHALVLFILSNYNYTGASNGITVTDSRGNTYTRLASTPQFVTFYVHCYVALNITALQSGDVITVTPFGATPWYCVIGYEVGALVTASALDVTAGTEQHDAGSANSKNTPDSGLTATTAAANEVILGAWGWDSLTTQITQTFTPTAGESWTGLTAANPMLQTASHEPGLWVAHKEPNATGTFKASGAFGTNVYALGALVVALKGAANVAPNAPALQTRPNFDKANVARFNWTFSDDDAGDTQGSYQLVITKVSDNSTAFDSGQVSSASQFHDLAANTLVNGTAYQWKVRTWDNHALVGAYSTLGSFSATADPTATITTPASDGATVTNPALTVAWTYGGGDAETSYRLRLLQGTTELWTTGQLAGAATSQLVGYTLQTGVSTYSVKLTVWDASGRVSSEVTRTFITSWPGAVTPTLTVTPQGTQGRIHLTWTCPAPTGGQAATDHVDLFRTTSGGSVWTRIATGQAATGTYDDYTVPFGTAFDYKATAVTAVGATQDSSTGSATITCEVQDIWLHAVSNPAGTAARYLLRGQRASHQAAAVTLQRYEGRAFPVSEFDATAADGSVTVDLGMTSTKTDITSLRALYALRDTVCYRDNRGRKIFGVLPNLDEVDSDLAYSVAITLQRNDYTEAG